MEPLLNPASYREWLKKKTSFLQYHPKVKTVVPTLGWEPCMQKGSRAWIPLWLPSWLFWPLTEDTHAYKEINCIQHADLTQLRAEQAAGTLAKSHGCNYVMRTLHSKRKTGLESHCGCHVWLSLQDASSWAGHSAFSNPGSFTLIDFLLTWALIADKYRYKKNVCLLYLSRCMLPQSLPALQLKSFHYPNFWDSRGHMKFIYVYNVIHVSP